MVPTEAICTQSDRSLPSCSKAPRGASATDGACQNQPVPVHDIAQRGFGSQAEAYERSRPSYPAEAVAWMIEALQLTPSSVLIDLAAGTGKLTRLLPSSGRVIAVEPVAGMRAVMRRVLRREPTDVITVAGVAEDLPLAASSVDALTVAQAFHWFDGDATWHELARVMRRTGRVALVWNTRDRTAPWVDEVWSIVDRIERNDVWDRHGSWLDSMVSPSDAFTPFTRGRFSFAQQLDVDGVVARVTGVSHIAALDGDARTRVLDEVRTVLATSDRDHDGLFTLPYRTDVAWCERR